MMTTANLALTRRILALSIAPVVVAAGIILYGFPGETAERFAWPIAPAMTAIAMGAGYLAATWFFFRLARARTWESVAGVLGGILAFTLIMLGSTLLHWDRFSHGTFMFWLWLVVYLLSPPVIASVIYLHRHQRDAPASDVDVDGWVRLWYVLLYAALGICAVLLIFAPAAMAGYWPWKLTPLSSRVLGGWLAVLAVGGSLICRSPHWHAWPIALETGAIWFALMLAAAPAARSSFPMQDGFSGFMIVLGVLLASFSLTWWVYESRARKLAK
jgi:hypothetical protein